MIPLVNMPFASLVMPSLALGQIKARLAQAGMPSKVLNLNLEFARRLGFGNFEILAKLRGVDTQLSEWLFAEAAWGRPFGPSAGEFLDLCSTEVASLQALPDPHGWLMQLRRETIPTFLEDCCDRILETGEPKTVGFSCMFFQTIASLALARRLKERCHSVRIVFGGACLHGEMGEEIISKATVIDAVSTGEADDVIVPLFCALLRGEEPAGLQGVLYRRAGAQVASGPPHRPVSVEVLEENPVPDYDDWFEELERVGLGAEQSLRVRTLLPYESSRGCWWGEKHQCAFCGLNGEGMAFRAKSPDRVMATLRQLAARYPIRKFMATDNIVPHSYYRTLLPRLADDPLSKEIEIWTEIKTNVERESIRLLSNSGVRYVTPGIESLSSNVLKCLGKGVRAIKNVHCLKLCRLCRVYPLWNLLIRVPGERREDYEGMLALLPKIIHYMPPFGGARKVELHRFSPYFLEKERYVTRVQPRAWYAGVFPADHVDLERIAYYFDAEWKDTLPDGAYDEIIEAVWSWIDIWKRATPLPHLQYDPLQREGLDISDTRFGRRALWKLDAREAEIYRGIDDPMSAARLHKRLGHRAGAVHSVKATLCEFVERGLAIEEAGQYLGLALPEHVYEPPLAYRRVLLQRVGQDAEREAA